MIVLGPAALRTIIASRPTRKFIRAIVQRTPMVPNMDTNFTIEQTNSISLERLPVTTNVFDFLGANAEAKWRAGSSLEDALLIAVRHNRAYQLRKEQTLQHGVESHAGALSLPPIFTGNGRARIIGQTEQAVMLLSIR